MSHFKMRLTIKLALLISSVTTSAYSAEARFTVAIENTVTAFPINTPIPLAVRLTNSSSAVMNIVDTSPQCDYRVTVWDHEGRLVPLLEAGRELYFGEACKTRHIRQASISLLPSTSDSVTLEITDLFDLRRPGRYKILVERTLPQTKRQEECSRESRPFFITIADAR